MHKSLQLRKLDPLKKLVCFFAGILLTTSAISQSFTYGNLVVVQAGDGSSTLASSATPVFLKEFTPTGGSGITFTVPVSANTLVISGSASSEGELTLSPDNKLLVFAGYNAAVGSLTIASTTTASVPRMIAWVDANGTISYTSSSSFFSGNNIRGAASDGSGNFWAAGGNSGTCYFGTASTQTAVQTTNSNTRYVSVVNGNLYLCTSSGTSGIYKIGSGLPVTSGQTTSLVINTSTVGTSPSPYAFYFNSAQTICYVADDRTAANGGGIQKWVNSSGTWTLAYTLATGTVGARGVVADFSGTTPKVYATTAESSLNRIVAISDAGASSTATTIATTATNTIFRGIAFAPCTTPSISAISSNTSICNTQAYSFSVTSANSGALTYSWSGPGTLSSYSVNNPALSSPVAGDYTINVTNGCGTATSVVSVSVSAGPTLSVNSPTICSGNQAVLNVSGASTYTWNSGASNASSFTVNPTGTTVFTVNGTSSGCNGTATTQVVVNNLPTLTVNSPTVCAGTSVTLTASGASTYTWSDNSNGTSLSLTPGTSINYTVTGTDVNSCSSTIVSTIMVNQSPTLSVNFPTVCAGSQATLTANGANTFTWSTSSTSASIVISPTITSTYSASGTSSAGCIGSTTAMIVVNPNPTLAVSPVSVCAGSSTTLSVSGASNYTWSTSSNSASIVVSPATSTVYTVSGTSLNCSSSVTVNVTVNPLPTLTANSATICSGATASLSVSGASTYTWSNSSNANNITVSPALSATYTVNGTSALGCSNSGTALVTVNNLPTITVNSSTICNGASATLTASGASSYSWNTSAATASISVTPSASAVYTVTGLSAQNCANSNTAQVTVNSNPAVTVNSPTICAGASATITASGATSYSWNTSATAASISATPGSSTVYIVTGTSLGCSSTATSNVIVNPLPAITINTVSICSGGTATLTASGASTYTWSTGSNSTSILVAPTVNTTYSVTGTSTAGCINSALSTISITSSPSIIVNSQTICIGKTATLSAGGVSTYTWSTNSNSPSIIVAPISNTTYTVSGNSSGCPVTVSNTVLVTVNPNPTVTVNSPTICAGSAATLSAIGAASYSWSTGSINNSITPSPSITTVYTVTGTSSLTCSSSNTVQVQVNANPTISANSSSVCPGSSATLVANGAGTYSWSNGAVTSSIIVSPTINTSYVVTGTLNGCSANNTASVSLFALPSVSVSTVSICSGGSATLVASGANTYSWSTGSTSVTAIVSPTLTSSYTVTGISSQGCAGTATTTVVVTNSPAISVNAATICAGGTASLVASGVSTYTWSTGSNSTNINVSPLTSTVYVVSGNAAGCPVTASAIAAVSVNPLPIVVVTSTAVCAGSSATLVASGAGSYAWSPSASGSSVVVTPTANISYTVTGTLNNCTNSATATITVNALPFVTVSSPTTICQNNSITLVAGGANNYSWNTGGTNSTISVSPSSTTSYTVTGISAQNCSNTAITTVSVNVLPSVSLSAPAGTVCLNDAPVVLVGSPSGGTFSGNGVSGSTFSPVSAGTGSYTLSYSYTDANSCSATAKKLITVSLCTGLKENAETVSVRLYPNPVIDNLNLEVTGISERYNVEITSLDGRVIYRTEHEGESLSVNASGLQAGLYFVRISAGEKTSSFRFYKCQ